MRFLYEEKDTFIHRMSPQSKVGAALILFTYPVTFNHPGYVAVVAVLAVCCAAAARAWGVLWRFRRLLLVLFVVSLVLWAVLLDVGEPIRRWGPISPSRTSILFGLAMAFRITAYVIVSLTFLAATSVEGLTTALRRFGLPYSLGFALSTSFRLVPTFVETTKMVSEAQRARGLKLDEGGPLARARKHVPILIPILACCLRRSSSMAMALEARGFGTRAARTSLSQARTTPGEIVLLTALAVAAAAGIALRLAGYGVLVPGRL